ncbi:SRPBCC family protein [Ascidiimonas aurantiaca]|uniref:SRPBCC family protein n=1 Tax=Ascidiimonas aurantiaca TaxID=1685432 RepID=UPI0030ED2C42
MKKLLKIVLGLVIVLVALVGILSLLAKDEKNISISSTQFVNAPVDVVYDEIRYLENYPNWSPFKVQDPEQKHKVTGQDGQVGATFHWEGVAEESKGSQTITELKKNKLVKVNCDITVPFQANPQFVYRLDAKNGGTEVTLDFDIEMKFPSNIIAYLLGLRDEMRATNQQGLDLLKELAEGKQQQVSLRP